MKTVDYARLAESVPVNVDAGLAYSMKGAAPLEPKCTPGQIHSHVPLPCKPVPHGQTDRTGQKAGRLTIIGYYGTHPKRGARWVVRCICGRYEVRSSKAFKRDDNGDQCCSACNKLQQVRRHLARQAYFDRHGRWPA